MAWVSQSLLEVVSSSKLRDATIVCQMSHGILQDDCWHSYFLEYKLGANDFISTAKCLTAKILVTVDQVDSQSSSRSVSGAPKVSAIPVHNLIIISSASSVFVLPSCEDSLSPYQLRPSACRRTHEEGQLSVVVTHHVVISTPKRLCTACSRFKLVFFGFPRDAFHGYAFVIFPTECYCYLCLTSKLPLSDLPVRCESFVKSAKVYLVCLENKQPKGVLLPGLYLETVH